jgi:hypothetical protein
MFCKRGKTKKQAVNSSWQPARTCTQQAKTNKTQIALYISPITHHTSPIHNYNFFDSLILNPNMPGPPSPSTPSSLDSQSVVEKPMVLKRISGVPSNR